VTGSVGECNVEAESRASHSPPLQPFVTDHMTVPFSTTDRTSSAKATERFARGMEKIKSIARQEQSSMKRLSGYIQADCHETSRLPRYSQPIRPAINVVTNCILLKPRLSRFYHLNISPLRKDKAKLPSKCLSLFRKPLLSLPNNPHASEKQSSPTFKLIRTKTSSNQFFSVDLRNPLLDNT